MNARVVEYCEKCECIRVFKETDRELLGVFTEHNIDNPYDYKKTLVDFECSTCKSEYSTIIEEVI